MFAIVGSVNYKKYREVDKLPPSYSIPMYPELHMKKRSRKTDCPKE